MPVQLVDATPPDIKSFFLKVVFMTQARRWKLSATQRAEMWSRWKAGQSLHAIGRALGKDHVVIQFLLARSGGMAPPVRRRSLRTLMTPSGAHSCKDDDDLVVLHRRG